MKTVKGTDISPALATALKRNPCALKNFELMPPSHQREYNKHVAEAKKEETKISRAEKVVKMIGKWEKYQLT